MEETRIWSQELRRNPKAQRISRQTRIARYMQIEKVFLTGGNITNCRRRLIVSKQYLKLKKWAVL